MFASSPCTASAPQQPACHRKTVTPLCAAISKISRIALLALSYSVAPTITLISFSIGFSAGLAYEMALPVTGDFLPRGGNLMPFCGEGYMEFFSDTKFPESSVRIVSALFIADHIDHSPNFYAPFCGLFVGLFVGRESVGYAKHAYTILS